MYLMTEGLFLATYDKHSETTYLFSKPLHDFSFLANYTSYFLQQQKLDLISNFLVQFAS